MRLSQHINRQICRSRIGLPRLLCFVTPFLTIVVRVCVCLYVDSQFLTIALWELPRQFQLTVRTHTHTHTQHIHTYTPHLHARAHTHARIYIHAHTQTRAHTHTRTHTHMHAMYIGRSWRTWSKGYIYIDI